MGYFFDWFCMKIISVIWTLSKFMFISGWYVVWTLFLKKFKFVRELLGTNSETEVQEKPKRSRGKLRRDWSTSEVFELSCNRTFCDTFLWWCVHSRSCASKIDRRIILCGRYFSLSANDLTECKMYGSTCDCALGWKTWEHFKGCDHWCNIVTESLHVLTHTLLVMFKGLLCI